MTLSVEQEALTSFSTSSSQTKIRGNIKHPRLSGKILKKYSIYPDKENINTTEKSNHKILHFCNAISNGNTQPKEHLNVEHIAV